MTTSHRRIALLTGASISALGVSSIFATPAFAAPHDALVDGTYAGTDTTSDTVAICDLATNPECFFGVINTVGGAAFVNSTANGEIYQHDGGGDVTLNMTNAAGSSAEVGAIAQGAVIAGASISGIGIYQYVTSGDNAVENFTNDGNLLIDASAQAGAFTAAAHIDTGIAQGILIADTASVNFANNDLLTVAAIAH